ncbi:MAG: zf-HC2 domain-containing protein [Vicinamibacterales bacterium]
MTECRQIAALLQLYADDQASAETNASVLGHLESCGLCRRDLQRILAAKRLLRETLGSERAPAGLRARLVAQLEPPGRHSIGVLVLRWLVPAAAAGLVAMVLVPWPTVASAQVKSAVAQHVLCALNGRAVRMLDTVAAQPGYARSMPWVSSSSSGVHIVDAHTCGPEHFAHLILEDRDSRASILVAQRTPGSKFTRPPDVVRDGRFDVDVLTTATHVAYLVVDRRGAAGQAAWRKSALDRVAQFLYQLEGP